ncbi:MAG TPA: alpha/beta fold hydrolase [Acetobacteraceae bacterium]|jgi:pimeloyl-ACP methyl ester carboxylesterase|nr:alpha/beta fold hydrolase [Acetobacteraceae bacterium]
MDAVVHRLSAWDGLSLFVREWRDGNSRTPLLCLPGIVRTSGDFKDLAQLLGAGRRVVSLDYAGRGQSGRSRDISRYAPEACLRDVLDICAALHLHDVIGIGTSFGGLLSMGLAAARPSLFRAVVLNDIGPYVGSEGTEDVRRFIGNNAAFTDIDAAVAHLRAVLPPLSLDGDAAWRDMAALTYAPDGDGMLRPTWDTRIAKLLNGKTPNLWALFGGLAHLPLLLVRGEASDILLPDTVARMHALRPDIAMISLPGIGHAPTLGEPEVVAALRAFLDRVG